jgi:predicted RNA binding protein YcfA (HicA-like mRNA interferase family)
MICANGLKLTLIVEPARQPIAILGGPELFNGRQRGWHKQFRHPDGRSTTVPDHRGHDVSPILLQQFAEDVGLTAEEFGRRDRRPYSYPIPFSLTID